MLRRFCFRARRGSGAAEGPGGSAGAALLLQPGSSPSARLSTPGWPACWPKQTACGYELHAHRAEPHASGQQPAATAPGRAPAPAGACRCSSRPCSRHSRPPGMLSGPRSGNIPVSVEVTLCVGPWPGRAAPHQRAIAPIDRFWGSRRLAQLMAKNMHCWRGCIGITCLYTLC